MIEQFVSYFTGMGPYEIITQLIGFLGTAGYFVSFQQKTKKKMLLWQIIAISVFTLHFFMLGAFTGALMNLFGLIRVIVYYNPDTKFASSRLCFWSFIAAYTIIGILTWEDWFSVFLLAAMLLSTVAFTKRDPSAFRLVSFPCSPMWLVYNIHNVSISGSITECCTMTSLIIAFIRYDIIGKRKAKTDQNKALEKE